MNGYWVAIFILIACVLVGLGVCLWLHQRLVSWRMVFGMLSNAERILLLWPHAEGGPIKTLSMSYDRHVEDGFARLHAGSVVLARFPLGELNKHRESLQALIDEGKK